MKGTRNILHVTFLVGAVCGLLVLIISQAALTNHAGAAADARTIYNRRCASCHGRDGRGQTRRGRQTHARDMTDGAWQDEVSDERLFNSINNGRGKMPAFRKILSENDVDALVAYVRRLRR